MQDLPMKSKSWDNASDIHLLGQNNISKYLQILGQATSRMCLLCLVTLPKETSTRDRKCTEKNHKAMENTSMTFATVED